MPQIKLMVVSDRRSLIDADGAIVTEAAHKSGIDVELVPLSFSDGVKDTIAMSCPDAIVTFGYRALHVFSGWRTISRNGFVVFSANSNGKKILPLPTIKKSNGVDMVYIVSKFISEVESATAKKQETDNH